MNTSTDFVQFEKLSLALPSEESWCKGKMYTCGGQCCLFGAVKLVTIGLIPAVGDAIKKHFGDRMGNIAEYGYLISSFNDHPETVWADVKKVIDEVEQS
jgi:hypothetical protein